MGPCSRNCIENFSTKNSHLFAQLSDLARAKVYMIFLANYKSTWLAMCTHVSISRKTREPRTSMSLLGCGARKYKGTYDKNLEFMHHHSTKNRRSNSKFWAFQRKSRAFDQKNHSFKRTGKKSSSDSYSIFFIVSKFVLKLKGQSLCLLALRCSLDLDRHSYKRRPKKIKGNVAPVLFQIWWWLYLDDTQCTIFVMSKLGGSEEISHPYFHFSRSQLSFSRSNTWYGATLVSTIFGFV